MESFKCYIINLDKNVDRFSYMKNQLDTLSIPFERFSAIYGKGLSETEIAHYYDFSIAKKNDSTTLNLGELGCAISHQEIYKKITSQKYDYTLILEDDVALPNNFKEIITKEINRNKMFKEWDYLSFDYYAYGFNFLLLWVPGVISIHANKNGLFNKLKFLIIFFIKFLSLLIITTCEELQIILFKNSAITPLKPTSFAGAYLITKKGAQKLLKVHDKILYIADRLPNEARRRNNLTFKIYTPLVVTQRKDIFASDLRTNN